MRATNANMPVPAHTRLTLALLVFIAAAMLRVEPAVAVEEIPAYRTRTEAGCHTTGIYPATKRLRNEETATGYSVDVCPGDTTVFRAPRVVLQPGFRAQRGSTFYAGTPVFDVHIAVLDPASSVLNTAQEFDDIVHTLNERFISEDNRHLARFRLKSFTTWAAIDGADMEHGATNEDPCVDYIHTAGDAFNTGNFAALFGNRTSSSCSTSDTVVRDMDALNVYIYDVTNGECHGKRNSGAPLIVLDHDRILDTNVNTRQNPEAHEMGHAFGCGHTCDDDVDSPGDDSHTMGSNRPCPTACGGGFSAPHSGGNRLRGFPHEPYPECSDAACPGASICQEWQYDGQPRLGQVQLVLWYAEEFARNFGMPLSWSAALPIRLPCDAGTCSHTP